MEEEDDDASTAAHPPGDPPDRSVASLPPDRSSLVAPDGATPAAAGRGASAILVIAALAPWLVMVPARGALAVLAHAIALVAAMHGAGLVLARLAGRPAVHPLLAIQWGLASLIGILGVAIAFGAGGLATQAVIVYGFAGIHTAAIASSFAAYRERVSGARPRLRSWLVPACLLAAISALHILGAAGDLGAYPFDDDGHVLAQIQRLRETGTLGDPIGYARTAQLGGQLAFDALATLGGDVHLVRLAEGLAFVLVIGLALARLRPAGQADATSGLWGWLLVLVGASFTYVRVDPAACWTAAGLILALHATLAEHDDAPLPAGVLAGALAALRLELVPVAAAALLAAWWPHRRDLRRTTALVIGALAVVGPYAAARILAWHSVPDAARALVAPMAGPIGARFAIFAGVAAACAPLVIVMWRVRELRWLGVASALAIAGIASQLTGARPYAASFLWPLAITGALVLVTQLVRSSRASIAACLVALVLVVLVQEGRTATGRKRWTRRYLDLAYDLDYLRSTRDRAPVSGGYEPLLREVPAGAVVAVWVARPERLDYGAAFRIIDLRTPRAAWIRAGLPWAPAGRVEALLAGLGAHLLLLEADDRAPARWAFAARYTTVAEAGGVRLIDLRRPR